MRHRVSTEAFGAAGYDLLRLNASEDARIRHIGTKAFVTVMRPPARPAFASGVSSHGRHDTRAH